MTVEDVKIQLNRGTDRAQIVQQLVDTGNWTRDGALSIVSLLTRGPDHLLAHNLRLPRPRRTRDPRGPGQRRGSWA